MSGFGGLDLLILLVYLGGVTVWGAWLGRGQRGGTDYFLGNRDLPWGAVSLSVVATETSTLTFLSIPGVAYLGTMGFLQLTLGYLVGRLIISAVLLPAYYRGDLSTAYGLLGQRFGVVPQRFTSAVFVGMRLLADGVRLFVTAIPLALITGWSEVTAIVVIGVVTLAYTAAGGIRAVVWVDAVQMGLYLVGAMVTFVALELLVPGGWGAILGQAAGEGKLQTLDFSLDISNPHTFWAGLLGGTFMSMGSHGTDHLMVQRLLTCRDLRSSQKALIGSGVAVMAQFAIFLLVGVGLWAFYQGRGFDRADAIFPTFLIQELPAGLTGLLIAGIFAAAMSTLSSSINSLASATAYDFWAPIRGVQDDDRRILAAGRTFAVLWAALLVTTAILYIPLSEDHAAVEVALALASVVYGGFLGAFLLAVFSRSARSLGVLAGMAVGIGAVAALAIVAGEHVGWPWYVPLGTVVTVAVGSAASAFLGRREEEA